MIFQPIISNYTPRKHNEYGYAERREVHDIQFLNLRLNREKFGEDIDFEQLFLKTLEIQLHLTDNNFRIKDFEYLLDFENGVVYTIYKINKRKHLVYVFDLFKSWHVADLTRIEYKYLMILQKFYNKNKLNYLDKEIVIDLIYKSLNKELQAEFDEQFRQADEKRKIVISIERPQPIADYFFSDKYEVIFNSDRFLKRIEELKNIEVIKESEKEFDLVEETIDSQEENVLEEENIFYNVEEQPFTTTEQGEVFTKTIK